MSLAADRAAFAAALDPIADITGYDDQPALLNVGDAWVRWAGWTPAGPPGTYLSSWLVDVITGGTPSDAMKFLDTHLELITDALDDLAYVTGVAPVDFQIPNVGVMHGAEITLHKEG